MKIVEKFSQPLLLSLDALFAEFECQTVPEQEKFC